MQSNRGFTLIELMVTIAVMGIIAAMAAPAMNNLVAKQRLNTTTRDLINTFTQARSQAVLLRREVTVTLNDSTKNQVTSFYWKASENSRLTSTNLIVVFKPDGTLKDIDVNSINFIICNSKAKKQKTIILARTGTLSMDKEENCI